MSVKFDNSSANRSDIFENGGPTIKSGKNTIEQNHWKVRTAIDRTQLQGVCRLFVAFLVAFLVAIIITTLLFANLSFESKVNSQPRFKRSRSTVSEGRNSNCTSTACVKQLTEMAAAMDPLVDPCQDFYQYACGRWNRPAPFKSKNKYWLSLYDRLAVDQNHNLQTILEGSASSLESKAEKSARRYYQSCLLQSRKTTYTLQDLDTTQLSLLNMIGGIQTTKWDFQEAFKTAQNVLNVDLFFHWSMKHYRGRYVIKLSYGGLTLPLPSYFLGYNRTTLISKFKNRMKEVMSFLDMQSDNSTFTSRISPTQYSLNLDDVIEVETRIAKIAQSAESSHLADIPIPIVLLDIGASFINWKEFFQSAFSEVSMAITPWRTVLVPPTRFIMDLKFLVNELLANARGRAKLKNYMYWHTLKSLFQPTSYAKNLEKDEAAINYDCVIDTAEAIPLALWAMYIRKRFKSESNSKHLAATMAKSIKEAYKENLENLDWMDDSTRMLLKDKVDAVTTLMGYPDSILNSTKLDEIYSGLLEFKSDDYITNKRSAKRYLFLMKLMKLDQPFDKTRWTDKQAPFDVYPSNDETLNRIFFPSGILHPPFFDVTFPDAINFGFVGTIFGHELQHGFSDEGLLHDRNGKFRDMFTWLKNVNIHRLKERSQCLIRQYSNYKTNNGHAIDGSLSLDENISDNGGLKAAFNAFINRMSPHEDALLSFPGITLTHKQLFFLSFAQVSCSSAEGDNDIRYSSNRHRVVGPLSNMPDFSSAFQCPLGSFMNPKEKCEIW